MPTPNTTGYRVDRVDGTLDHGVIIDGEVWVLDPDDPLLEGRIR